MMLDFEGSEIQGGMPREWCFIAMLSFYLLGYYAKIIDHQLQLLDISYRYKVQSF